MPFALRSTQKTFCCQCRPLNTFASSPFPSPLFVPSFLDSARFLCVTSSNRLDSRHCFDPLACTHSVAVAHAFLVRWLDRLASDQTQNCSLRLISALPAKHKSSDHPDHPFALSRLNGEPFRDSLRLPSHITTDRRIAQPIDGTRYRWSQSRPEPVVLSFASDHDLIGVKENTSTNGCHRLRMASVVSTHIIM